jgi:hypothetical protein
LQSSGQGEAAGSGRGGVCRLGRAAGVKIAGGGV